MTSLLAVIPKSIPGAKKALALMERDLDAAKTYTAIRKIERVAEAFKKLFAEVDDVRQDCERVIVFANHRIGEELRAMPSAKGAREPGTKRGTTRAPDKPASLKDQVGSTQRGKRLKKLAAIPKGVVQATVAQLQEAGKEATVSAVIKTVTGDDKTARRAAREVNLGTKIRALPDKRYGVIYADPPWRFEPYSRETGMDRAADNHYPTMPFDDIKEMAVPAADDCVLFMWAIVPMLPEALAVMTAWGFKYVSSFAWVKDRIGTGYWTRNQHELLLIGVRGTVPAPAPGKQYPSVFTGPVEEHSKKPYAFRAMIEDIFPTLPRIELFARTHFEGWDCWGNEVAEAAE